MNTLSHPVFLCINQNQISLIQRAVMLMRKRVCQIGNILKSNNPPPPRLKGTKIKGKNYEIIKKSFLINLLNKYSYLLYFFLFKTNFCLFITFLFYHSLKCIGCILIIFYKHPCTVFLNNYFFLTIFKHHEK